MTLEKLKTSMWSPVYEALKRDRSARGWVFVWTAEAMQRRRRRETKDQELADGECEVS